MPAANEVTIRINADGTAVVTGVQKIESQVNQSTLRIKDAWIKLGAVMASTVWLQSAAKDALAAEQAATKLKFQIESLGVSYANTSGAVQDAINKTSEYARVQDDEATKTLQTLIFNSGKYKESLENLNLVYDLAYQKGIGVEESAMLIGKAMTGNAEMLGRYIPELRDLEQILGKNATETQKFAYAMLVLKEKTEGAIQAMGEHEKQIRETEKAYQDLKQIAGQVALAVASAAVNVFAGIGSAINYVISMAAEGLAKIYDLLGKIPGSLGEPYRQAAQSVREFSQQSFEASEIGARFAERFKIASAVVEQHTEAAKKATGAAKDLAKSIKEESDEIDRHREMVKAQIEEAKKWQEQYDENEKKIRDVERETIKLTETTDAYINSLMFEMVQTGATTDQIDRYRTAIEDSMVAQEKAAAQKQLNAMGPAPETMGEKEIPQQFDEAAQMQERLDAIAAFYTEKIRLQIEAGQTEAQINATMGQAQLAHDKQVNQMRLAQAQGTFAMMANIMQNLYAASGQKNKAAFQAMKAFAIAETTINTIRSAQSVFAGMTSMIPGPIGIALGLVAAAAAVAAGMARVKQISSMNPGGATATISAGGNANPSYAGGSPSAYPAPERLEQKKDEKAESKTVTVVVNGNIVDHAAFAREIAPYMGEAKGDKVSYGN